MFFNLFSFRSAAGEGGNACSTQFSKSLEIKKCTIILIRNPRAYNFVGNTFQMKRNGNMCSYPYKTINI